MRVTRGEPVPLDDPVLTWIADVEAERDAARAQALACAEEAKRLRDGATALIVEMVTHWHTTDDICAYCVFCQGAPSNKYRSYDEKRIGHKKDCVYVRARRWLRSHSRAQATE